MWPKRFVYACAVKIVGAWHLVSSALAFSPPLNIPWRDAGLCGIREDKRWSWLFSRKKSEHHAFIYPREHTRTNISSWIIIGLVCTCANSGRKERADCVWTIGG